MSNYFIEKCCMWIFCSIILTITVWRKTKIDTSCHSNLGWCSLSQNCWKCQDTNNQGLVKLLIPTNMHVQEHWFFKKILICNCFITFTWFGDMYQSYLNFIFAVSKCQWPYLLFRKLPEKCRLLWTIMKTVSGWRKLHIGGWQPRWKDCSLHLTWYYLGHDFDFCLNN